MRPATSPLRLAVGTVGDVASACPLHRRPLASRRMALRRILRGALLPGALLASPAAARPLAAQLRPLEPMDWRAFDPGTRGLAQLGGAIFFHQRVSISQIAGRLVEAPGAILSWTTGEDGRLALRAIIHPLRLLRVDSSFGPPLATATQLASPIRDGGDNALETVLRLTSARETAGPLLAVRWGVRLSTHNQRKGLDRHKTDVYATLGGRLLRGSLTLAGEGGLGVYGTQAPGHDKVLPFLYDASARWRLGALEPSLALVGQATPAQIRGNENLAELRAGLRAGRARYLEATAIRGLARYGPRWGVLVFAGVAVR